MFRKENYIYFALVFIFFLALFLRVYRLGTYPAGFHIDEASLGYNAYSILITGKDDNGNSLPLYIDMFGDNRPAGYHYLTIVPVIIFGLTEFATRFPAALFGSLTVFPFYLFAFSIARDKKISLLSALLIAISPWHIILSRASAEAVVALFFIILGFSLFFSVLITEKKKYFILAGVSLVVSYFFYHTPRVFVPMIFLVLSAFLLPAFKHIKRNLLYTGGIFLCISLVAFCLVFLVKGGTGRFNQVNIFGSFETQFQLITELREDGVSGSPRYISRFFHNKITNNAYMFVNNYFEYFSGNFLFTKGGLPIWYIIPRIGLVNIVELPFILFGIYYLVRKKEKIYKVPLIWLCVSPIVASITLDDIPNINRAIVMIPALELISAVGLLEVIKIVSLRKRNLFLGVLSFAFLFNFLYFLNQYFFNSAAHNTWYRNNGFSKMMQVVNENYNSYDRIIISKFQGGIYPLVLFYSKFDPKTYQAEGSTKNRDYTGFGKFFFVPQDCPSTQRTKFFPNGKKKIFVDRGDCPMEKSLLYKKVVFINREDTTKAFRIVYE